MCFFLAQQTGCYLSGLRMHDRINECRCTAYGRILVKSGKKRKNQKKKPKKKDYTIHLTLHAQLFLSKIGWEGTCQDYRRTVRSTKCPLLFPLFHAQHRRSYLSRLRVHTTTNESPTSFPYSKHATRDLTCYQNSEHTAQSTKHQHLPIYISHTASRLL